MLHSSPAAPSFSRADCCGLLNNLGEILTRVDIVISHCLTEVVCCWLKACCKNTARWQEQLDAVRNELISDDNYDLRQSIYCAFLEDAERGANMIINFAREKGLKIDAGVEDVVQAMNKMSDDIEMTPEMLASVSGAGLDKCD